MMLGRPRTFAVGVTMLATALYCMWFLVDISGPKVYDWSKEEFITVRNMTEIIPDSYDATPSTVTSIHDECNSTLKILTPREAQIPVIYALTPTYARMVQKADLTRLAQTLLNVPKFCWIVIEDSYAKTNLVSSLLARSEVPYVHLAVKAPVNKTAYSYRGQMQRQAGLTWIRQNVDITRTSGVLYVMDDDNTYDIRVFEEMRYTRKVSIFPVGLVGGAEFEAPVVKNGKVIKWAVRYDSRRTFPVDFAGVAVNIKVFFDKPNVKFDLISGVKESAYLRQFANVSDLEPKAKNCTEVLVWHTKTSKVKFGPYTEKELQRFGIKPIEV